MFDGKEKKLVEDELIRLDRIVRCGLAVGQSETIRSAALRIVAFEDWSLKVEAARALLEPDLSDPWRGLKTAAAILTRES